MEVKTGFVTERITYNMLNCCCAQPRPDINNPRPISTNNNNLAVLCFREADAETSGTWGSQLLQGCSNKSVQKRVHVISSMQEVDSIPACRAALVFVDPDERGMIIEDPLLHIGQGLRRHAVQRLLDSGGRWGTYGLDWIGCVGGWVSGWLIDWVGGWMVD